MENPGKTVRKIIALFVIAGVSLSVLAVLFAFSLLTTGVATVVVGLLGYRIILQATTRVLSPIRKVITFCVLLMVSFFWIFALIFLLISLLSNLK